MKNHVFIFSAIVIIGIVFTFVGCDMFGNGVDNTTTEHDSNGGDDTTTTVALSDSRFNGEFEYFDYESSDDYWYETYEFDGSSKVSVYSKYEWWDGSSWHYSGDYLGDYTLRWYEIEVSNGEYRQRLWDNSDSEWSEWA